LVGVTFSYYSAGGFVASGASHTFVNNYGYTTNIYGSETRLLTAQNDKLLLFVEENTVHVKSTTEETDNSYLVPGYVRIGGPNSFIGSIRKLDIFSRGAVIQTCKYFEFVALYF